MVSTNDVYNNAVNWVGQGPYVWGGSAHTGNDCSGFVCGVLAEVGAPFPARTTAEGIRQQCTLVEPGDERPGDLVFFQNTDPDIWNRERPGPDGKIASHIGFVDVDWPTYMLDSHERSGDPNRAVNYTNISGSYWQSKKLEVRRIPWLTTDDNASPVPDPTDWYKNFIGNLLAPDGEIRPAVEALLTKRNLAETRTEVQNVLNRLDKLWSDYNG